MYVLISTIDVSFRTASDRLTSKRFKSNDIRHSNQTAVAFDMIHDRGIYRVRYYNILIGLE